MNRKIIFVGLLALILVATPVSAQEITTTTPTEDEDDNSGILNGIQNLIDTIQDFTQGKTLGETITDIIFWPFRKLAEVLLGVLITVLTTTPTVHPNPAVSDVHQDTLIISYAIAGLGFAATGILYIIGPVLNISYNQARKTLPRLVVALIFATLSLPLLQYAVDLSNAFTHAFTPQIQNIQQVAGLSTGLVIAWVVESVLLLAVVTLFLIRNVYILFGAAVSPLLAVMWSLPKVRRYADTFIAGWFAALLIGPADVLVLKFSLSLLRGAGSSGLQSVSNWMFGVTSFTLLLLVPYQIWTASQTAVGQAHTVSNSFDSSGDPSDDDPDLTADQRQRLRENQRKRANSETTSRVEDFRRRLR